jgi:hypothetical protein
MSYPRPTVALAPDIDPGILPSLTATILMVSVLRRTLRNSSPVNPGTRLRSVRALKYRSTLLLDALEKRASVTPPTISWVPKHSNHVPFALITPIW